MCENEKETAIITLRISVLYPISIFVQAQVAIAGDES